MGVYQLELTEKQELKKEYAIRTIFGSFFSGTFAFDMQCGSNEIDEMMKDSDIKSAVNSIKMAVHKRKLCIKNNKKEIEQELFSKYEKIITPTVIETIIDSRFAGYSVQELMYNDNYDVIQIKKKPRRWFYTKWDDVDKKWKWGFDLTGLTSGKYLPECKFLISIHNAEDDKPKGQADLESIYKYWKIKNNALIYADEVVRKYGGIVTWFTFTEGTNEKELQNMVDGMANIQGGSVMPIPTKPNNPQQGVNKEFGFINLSDLTSDIHQKMIEFCKNQISEYILGNSLIQRQGDTGSYASSQTANEIRGEYVDAYCTYIVENLNVLLQYETAVKGIDNSKYTFSMELPEDVIAKEDLKSKKLENFKKVKEIGYQVASEYVSEQTGIPIEYLQPIPESPNVFGVPGMAQFEKKVFPKKILFRKNSQKFWETITKNKSVVKSISKVCAEEIRNIKSEQGIDKISIDLSKSTLDEVLILAELQGRIDVIEEKRLKEFALYEYDFDMPFEEAIANITNKYPVMAEYLEEINKTVADKMFWIKKATDEQTVKRIQQSLEKVLKTGGTFASWKEDIESVIVKQGFGEDGYYLQNIYRTNLMSAYNAGRKEQQLSNVSNAPYWLFDAIEDERTSDICTNLNGKIYKADNPIWDDIYPPLHYGCRSGVISLDEDEFAEAKKYGETYIEDLDEETNTAVGKIRNSDFAKGFGDSSGNNS